MFHQSYVFTELYVYVCVCFTVLKGIVFVCFHIATQDATMEGAQMGQLDRAVMQSQATPQRPPAPFVETPADTQLDTPEPLNAFHTPVHTPVDGPHTQAYLACMRRQSTDDLSVVHSPALPVSPTSAVPDICTASTIPGFDQITSTPADPAEPSPTAVPTAIAPVSTEIPPATALANAEPPKPPVPVINEDVGCSQEKLHQFWSKFKRSSPTPPQPVLTEKVVEPTPVVSPSPLAAPSPTPAAAPTNMVVEPTPSPVAAPSPTPVEPTPVVSPTPAAPANTVVQPTPVVTPAAAPTNMVVEPVPVVSTTPAAPANTVVQPTPVVTPAAAPTNMVVEPVVSTTPAAPANTVVQPTPVVTPAATPTNMVVEPVPVLSATPAAPANTVVQPMPVVSPTPSPPATPATMEVEPPPNVLFNGHAEKVADEFVRLSTNPAHLEPTETRFNKMDSVELNTKFKAMQQHTSLPAFQAFVDRQDPGTKVFVSGAVVEEMVCFELWCQATANCASMPEPTPVVSPTPAAPANTVVQPTPVVTPAAAPTNMVVEPVVSTTPAAPANTVVQPTPAVTPTPAAATTGSPTPPAVANACTGEGGGEKKGQTPEERARYMRFMRRVRSANAPPEVTNKFQEAIQDTSGRAMKELYKAYVACNEDWMTSSLVIHSSQSHDTVTGGTYRWASRVDAQFS